MKREDRVLLFHLNPYSVRNLAFLYSLIFCQTFKSFTTPYSLEDLDYSVESRVSQQERRITFWRMLFSREN